MPEDVQHEKLALAARRAVAYAESVGLSCADLDDTVHDLKADEAAEINNSGLEAQLLYICGPAAAGAPRTPDQLETELRAIVDAYLPKKADHAQTPRAADPGPPG